jgi:hypothetical protein
VKAANFDGKLVIPLPTCQSNATRFWGNFTSSVNNGWALPKKGFCSVLKLNGGKGDRLAGWTPGIRLPFANHLIGGQFFAVV